MALKWILDFSVVQTVQKTFWPVWILLTKTEIEALLIKVVVVFDSLIDQKGKSCQGTSTGNVLWKVQTWDCCSRWVQQIRIKEWMADRVSLTWTKWSTTIASWHFQWKEFLCKFSSDCCWTPHWTSNEWSTTSKQQKLGWAAAVTIATTGTAAATTSQCQFGYVYFHPCFS